MSYKRIIPCMDIRDGKTVKGVQFQALKTLGDPIQLAQIYVEEGADELVFLDITATMEKRKTLSYLTERIADKISIPFTVGGGIASVADAVALIEAGAAKVSIGSAAIRNPELIAEISRKIGSKKLVVAIDVKSVEGQQWVFIKGGREKTEWQAEDWAREVEQLGAGEILLTSMNKDGTKSGFDLELTDTISRTVKIPVIASGGAGNAEDFVELFTKTGASAGLAAGIFHYGEVGIPELKELLKENNIPLK